MENKFKDLEYNCVIESLQTDHIFNLTFLERFQESMLNNSISILECDKLLSDNQKKYSMMLDEALEQLMNTKVDTENLSTFFNRVYNSINIERTPITIPVRQLTDVEKIRPQYLIQMVADILSVCNKITHNDITSAVQLEPYMNDDFLIRYKRQVVKSNIPVNVGDKIESLLSYGKPILCEVNQEFFQTTCMPFLRSYTYNVKELGDTNNNIRNAISKCYENIKTYMKTVDGLKANNKLTDIQFSLLRQFLFNATNKFLNLASYTVFMTIRRINDFTFNLNSFMYLYNELSRYYPEGDGILHESVIDGSFEDIDNAELVFELVRNNSSTMKVIADNILNKVKTDLSIRSGSSTGDLFHSVIDVSSKSKDYDISVYEDITDMLLKISQDINTLKSNMNDEFMLIDELMHKSNFDNKLSNRFMSIITSINNIDCYTGVLDGDNGFSDSDVVLTIINELNDFDENIDVITRNIHETYEDIRDFIDRLESNVNAEFSNDATRLEVVDKMKTIEMDFSDLVMLISKEILSRLHSLSDVCKQIEFRSSNVHDHDGPDLDLENTENYAEGYRDIEIDMLNLEYMYATESMVNEFNNKLIEKKYGITLYEAEQPAQSTQPAQQPAKPGENAGNKPLVTNSNTVEAENNEAANTQANTNNQTNNPDDAKKKIELKKILTELVNSVKAFFNEKTAKFAEMVQRKLGNNKQWLDEKAPLILGRQNWNPLAINLNQKDGKNKYYWMDFKGIFNEIHPVILKNINGLTEEKLNSINTDEIDKYIFSFIDENSKEKTTDAVLNKLIYNTNSKEPITISGAPLKKYVSEMIDYCYAYLNGDALEINRQIEAFGTTVSDKLKTFENVEKAKRNRVASLTQFYAGHVLNTQRDRFHAYLSALSSLVPKQTKVDNSQEAQNITVDEQKEQQAQENQ